MNIRRLVSLIAVAFYCIAACAYAEVVGSELPGRVPVSIILNEEIARVSAEEYETCIYESEEMLYVEGACEAGTEPVFVINGADADAAGCVLSSDGEGGWKCSIPVASMKVNANNVLGIYYADDEENTVILNIYVDGECALLTDDVYSSDSCVCGTTDPYAETELFINGEAAGSACADESGRFCIEFSPESAAEDAEMIIRAVDAGGNANEAVIDVIPVDIILTAPQMAAESEVFIEIQAIPGSSVQLLLEGKPCGDIAYIDKQGNGRACVSGLRDGMMNNISAVYADEFAAFDYESKDTSVYADMTPPVISSDAEYVDSTADGLDIDVTEDCTVIVADNDDYIGIITVASGESTIGFDELDPPLNIGNGMEITVSAADAAGNQCAAPLVYSILPGADETLCVYGWNIGETKTLNAMEDIVLSGYVYVQDEGSTLDIAVTGKDGEYVLYRGVARAQAAQNGAVLPSVIPFEIDVDTDKLTVGSELMLRFTVMDDEGNALPYSERYVLNFVLEKDIKWLIPRLLLFTFSAACFAAALVRYISVNKKQRSLKRNNGIRRRVRAGKRGGAWR